jgi:hypothetical protein
LALLGRFSLGGFGRPISPGGFARPISHGGFSSAKRPMTPVDQQASSKSRIANLRRASARCRK